MSTISKLSPHRTMYLRGFDRRGAAASLHRASAAGFTVSGCWSDQADFAVLVLFDADDIFGHLYTSRYLPNFSLAGVTLDFDLALTGCMSPISAKFPSVPWDKISYIKSDETSGTVALPAPTSTTGGAAASCTFTLAGTPTTFDRVQIVYLGNVVYDLLTITTGQTLADVAADLAALINNGADLTATSSGATVTVTCARAGADGNSIELVSMYKATGNTSISPAKAKLTGGSDPTAMHFHLNFSTLGLSSVRQLWLTLAPALTYDSGGVNPTLVAYAPTEFSAVFSGWTVGDPGAVTPLKIAGPGSTIVNSEDAVGSYAGSGWAAVAGWYLGGFARQSAHAGDTVTARYSCQHAHNLYLGTTLSSGGGQFSVSVDGGAAVTVRCYANAGSPISARRLIATGLAAGNHTVALTVAAGAHGSLCVFDYVQAAVLSDPAAPASTYSQVNCACDFDTDQTYKLAPARALWILSQAGFAGDIDFYAGVFFALKRVRSGGTFRTATVTLAGPFGTGTGFGDGDTYFFNIGGTSMGAAVYPADTAATLAQRLVDAINATFVGARAALTGPPGQFAVTTLSPINGFTMSVSAGVGSTGSIAMTGDIGVGNEGTWAVDAAQAAPLNRAFVDYLTDFADLLHSAGQTITVAFSQELLGPPDANTAGGAWSQRFADGSTVLTATGFGSWGAGVVEANASGAIQWPGHGFVTGNRVHLADGAGGGGVWDITVTDADHFTLTTQISNTGGYIPAAGDGGFIELQTTQCNFNPATTTAYLQKCYLQAAGILAAAGLTPWLQFGEAGWWFFSRLMNEAVGYASWTAPISVGTVAAHGLGSGQTAIVAGVKGTTAANGTWPIAVTDATHFTETGSNGNAAYAAGGTVSGGGMAFYDAYTAAAAAPALGRVLASFWTQDDDPALNAHADADFLRGQLYTHMHAIAQAIKGAYAGAQCEWLLPLDVNNPAVYWTAAYPYPQGGRLNNYVNIPALYMAPNGDIDRVKIEALSWGSAYGNLSLAKAAMAYGSKVLSYPQSAIAYLAPWSSGACAWQSQYVAAVNAGVPLINFWAFDHLCMLSWPVPPLPRSAGAMRRTRVW